MKVAAILLVGYLLGSFNIAVIITKWILKNDVRGQGSHNAGATNVARVYGMGLGLITLAGDFAKTAAAMIIGRAILGELGACAAGMGCLIGHSWPVFFGFKGGKGVAVAGAVALMLDFRLFLILIAIFLSAFFICRMVSLSSLIAAFCFSFVYYLLGGTAPYDITLGIFVTVLVFFLHRANILRLIKHEEPKFIPKFKKWNSK
ncbi:MAG: glycerol-3-phosphate 1-O-acyltransferase PlsY [Oscillospiraceae bacterium]